VLENIIWFIEKIFQHWSLYFKGKNNAVNKKNLFKNLYNFILKTQKHKSIYLRAHSTFYFKNFFYLKL